MPPIARKVEEQWTAGGRKLSPSQWSELLQACRVAKESLLLPGTPDPYHLSIAAEGGRLIGGSMSARISRADIEAIVLDGFFPRCDPGDLPHRTARVALQEFGLPYAQDPAVTRQLAGFPPDALGGRTPGCDSPERWCFQLSCYRVTIGGRAFQLVACHFR
jgi:hypothetical protein